MKANESDTGSKQPVNVGKKPSAPFEKVHDQRGRRLRGLWKRGDSYYAQLAGMNPVTGAAVVRRVRLEDSESSPVRSVAEAVRAQQRLAVRRETEETLTFDVKRTPNFSEYCERYLDHHAKLQAKREKTLRNERSHLERWKEFLGPEARLRSIDTRAVNRYMAERRAAGISAGAINSEHITLRNLLKLAKTEKYLRELPIQDAGWLKYRPKEQPLLTHAEIEKVCAACVETSPLTGQAAADFVRLSAYSGGRLAETLRLKWSDVDFARGQLFFGSDGLAKNGRKRHVDFSPNLRAHLEDMSKRRQPDSEHLFPSRRHGVAMESFPQTIKTAREKAGVPHFHVHLCRHFFASTALMAGIDIQTVASWLGHRDGGILLGKTYSHLLNEHKKSQAERLCFGPTLLSAAAND